MRKFFLLCLALCLCWSTSAQTQRYHVTGTAEGTEDGDTIYLAVMTGFFSLEPTDTTIVHNGGFSFDGTIDGADMRVAVAMHKGQMVGMTDFILENTPISLQIFPQDSNKKPVVKGGQTQKLYDEVTKEDDDFSKLMDNHTNNPTTPHCHKTYAIGHKLNWTRYVKLASLATTTTSWLISRRPSATCYCNGMRKI